MTQEVVDDALPPASVLIVHYSADNGSLPPPYRRSTRLHLHEGGRANYVRQLGYDLNDASRRFEAEFFVSDLDCQPLLQQLRSSGALQTRWRAQERPPVGGPVVNLQIEMDDQRIEVPAFPIARQAALAQALRDAVLALLPPALLAQRSAWEKAQGECE